MLNNIVIYFSQFPPEIATFFLSMLPFTELRLALPMAIFSFHLSPATALFWSVMGNAVPPTIILFFASPFHKWITKKSGFFSKAWIKYLHRAQEKFAKDYQKWGLPALLLFVAIPLPMTGAFTGAVAAFVFGIPFKKSWPFIYGGIVIAGVIVSLISLGVVKVF